MKPAVVLLLAMLSLGSVTSGQGQTPFRVGDVVTTNFVLQNRFHWTNDNGQVFTSSNSTIRLSDFDGKIAFFIFFEVW